MSNLLIFGSNSDIARELDRMFVKDGWTVQRWARTQRTAKFDNWDLCLIALGRIAPVGFWAKADPIDWELTIESNLIAPYRLLRSVWGWRNPHASVCFLAGSNPNMVMAGYSAYNTGKMALLKLCEQLDAESDAKLFALGPGIVLTKIHNATLEAKWPNPKLEQAMKEGKSTDVKRIYSCLTWCLRQSKSVVGGRNICVSDSDDWDNENNLQLFLESDDWMFKLRRQE